LNFGNCTWDSRIDETIMELSSVKKRRCDRLNTGEVLYLMFLELDDRTSASFKCYAQVIRTQALKNCLSTKPVLLTEFISLKQYKVT